MHMIGLKKCTYVLITTCFGTDVPSAGSLRVHVGFVNLKCSSGDIYIYIYIYIYGPGSVVGIATAYGLDGPGIESR